MSVSLDLEQVSERLSRLLAEAAPLENVLKSPPSEIKETAIHDFSQYLFMAPPTLGYALGISERVRDVGRAGETFAGIGPDERGYPLGFGGLPSSGGIATLSETAAGFSLVVSQVFDDLPSRIFLVYEGTVSEGSGIADSVAEMVVVGIRSGLVEGEGGLYAHWRGLHEPEWYWSFADSHVRRILLEEIPRLRGIPEYVADITAAGLDPARVIHEYVIRDLSDGGLWLEHRPEIRNALQEEANRRASEAPVPAPESNLLSGSYPFVPYAHDTVNLGLQLVYRQTWVPLGYQEGEILRTLPLGPKQSEKVSIKAIHRTKATRQMEAVTAIETATESSTATKDSQEIVSEASDTFKWNAEASASASFGFGSASLSAGMGGESASSSRDTKSTLNETMAKTASRMRQETKIVVSTEVEETTELSRESEISNPNDEVAVTYIYSRLQRQYEIHTELAEANACVFVAERIPLPSEITGRWIRGHDTILARALLDESYRKDLEVIRAQEPRSEAEEVADKDPAIANLMGGIVSRGLPQFDSLEGTAPDVYSNPQASYEREVERERVRRAEREQYSRSVRRLQWHIFENILHYCRAIWASEDPQQRLLRYASVTVPTEWSLVGSYTAEGVLEGVWRPELRPTASLANLINPAGPIGFAGNYAIFYLKQDGRFPDIDDAVGYLRLPYLRHRASGELLGGSPGRVTVEVDISPNRLGTGEYQIDFVSTPPSPSRCEISLLEADDVDGRSVYTVVAATDMSSSGGELEFHGLRVRLVPAAGEALQHGDRFAVNVFADPLLEDPELRAIRFRQEPLSPEQESEFFSAEMLSEFEEFFPEVATAFGVLDPRPGQWSDLDASTRKLVRDLLPDYVLRKQHTRRFLLDTNNVLLSRAVDPASSLEPFKSLHRYLDVLSAAADLEAKQIENRRRQRRIDIDKLGDPDVERVTVVTQGALGDFPAVDPTDDDA
ncbi:MAG: hypothetical protein ACREAA_19845 [Candidatus Polarisedimenticolia bacterium]